MSGEIVLPNPTAEIISTSDAPRWMDQIRPQWQAKGLIERVRKLLPVDPSSACQRLLNAAIADLREKIKIAGLDIAKAAASEYKLPPVERPENVDDYSVSKLIDLAYRMGLLTRPEWRRLTRVYDIRKDLEHEDSEYEAGVEDLLYIFKTCIEAVLSKDPVTLIRVAEVKQVVEAAGPAVADAALVEDYAHAPDTRQLEILKFLVSTALNAGQPDLVRQNAFAMLIALMEPTRGTVRVQLATHVQNTLGRNPLTELHVRVANAIGILPYLRKAHRVAFFREVNERLKTTGHRWTSNASHGALLRSLREYGGLAAIPDEELTNTLRWLVLCYVGESGGYGAGIRRKVFFSNSAAPLITTLIEEGADTVRGRLAQLGEDREVKRALQADSYVERRYQDLLDLVEE